MDADNGGGLQSLSQDEIVLGRIWCESLKVPAVARQDNFFELGGDSVLAMTVLEEVAVRLSVHLPLLAIFRCPTIQEMAELVARRRTADPDTLQLEEDGFL